MLPLNLLKSAQGHAVLIELKNGETYNGHIVQVDTWMNVHMREVICTSRDGQKFWRMAQAYIRGNTIKCMRIPDEVMEKAKESDFRRDERRPVGMRGGRGGGRGRGPGRDGGRGGGRGGEGRGGRGGEGGRGGGGGGGGRGGRGE